MVPVALSIKKHRSIQISPTVDGIPDGTLHEPHHKRFPHHLDQACASLPADLYCRQCNSSAQQSETDSERMSELWNLLPYRYLTDIFAQIRFDKTSPLLCAWLQGHPQ